MNPPADIEKKFWKALRSDRTVMLGVVGAENSHARPMTAQLVGDEGPIWFFGSKESALADNLAAGGRHTALMVFAAKDHDLFASVHGSLSLETGQAMVERLWKPSVAAWYKGKDDPKMLLMCLNPSEGQNLARRFRRHGRNQDDARRRPERKLQGQSGEGRSELTATPASPAVNSVACRRRKQRSALPARPAQVNAGSNLSNGPGLSIVWHASGIALPPQLGANRLERSIDEHDRP